MYKDKDKQKEASRLASQRRRNKQKGMTPEGMTDKGMTQTLTDTELLNMPVLPVHLDPDADWSPEAIMALTPGQAKGILNSWAAGNGTEYQRRVGFLSQYYSRAGLPWSVMA